MKQLKLQLIHGSYMYYWEGLLMREVLKSEIFFLGGGGGGGLYSGVF